MTYAVQLTENPADPICDINYLRRESNAGLYYPQQGVLTLYYIPCPLTHGLRGTDSSQTSFTAKLTSE
jgi:hypothetical protein